MTHNIHSFYVFLFSKKINYICFLEDVLLQYLRFHYFCLLYTSVITRHPMSIHTSSLSPDVTTSGPTFANLLAMIPEMPVPQQARHNMASAINSLCRVVDRTPQFVPLHGLETHPSPFVLRSELADYAVVYEVNAYPSSVNALPKLESDLRANILDVFNENHVQIMTPSYIADPTIPKIAPTDKTKEVETNEL